MATITLPEDASGFCRTCLNSSSVMYEIFDENEDSLSVAKMLTTCTAIKLDADDGRLPKKLCHTCYHNLMSFYDFKRLAEEVDQKLHEHFDSTQSAKTNIKYEINESGTLIEHFNDYSHLVKIKDENNSSEDSMSDKLINLIDNEENSTQNIEPFERQPRMERSLRTRNYTCTICALNFKYHTSYVKHIAKHAKNMKKLVNQSDYFEVSCEICSATFKSKNSLAAHQRKHVAKDRVLACRHCGKVFKKLSHVKRHELCHEDNRPFKCSECKKSFLTQNNLLDHIDYKHKGIRQYPCPICSKGFGQQAVLSNHMKIHLREKPYLCPTCGKRFDSSTNLKQHMSRHIGIKTFECDQCPKKFVTKGEAKNHRETHTNIKAFACDKCGATFTKQSSLKKHAFKHLGVRPFKCESCPLSFMLKEHLKVHTRIHTGEKPYRCEHCERAFAQSGDLLKHKRAHFGGRLYKCDECGESFRLKCELRDHVSGHYVQSKGALKNNTSIPEQTENIEYVTAMPTEAVLKNSTKV